MTFTDVRPFRGTPNPDEVATIVAADTDSKSYTPFLVEIAR